MEATHIDDILTAEEKAAREFWGVTMEDTHIDDILTADEKAAREFAEYFEEFGRIERENNDSKELIEEMENFF